MRLLCNISPPLSQFPNPQSPPFFPNFTRKALIGALSFTLLISSPSPSPSLSLHPPSSPQSPPSEICREQVSDDGADSAPDSAFTNEGIVEEAWEIVNESFLDAGRRRWSLETWQVDWKSTCFLHFLLSFVDFFFWGVFESEFFVSEEEGGYKEYFDPDEVEGSWYNQAYAGEFGWSLHSISFAGGGELIFFYFIDLCGIWTESLVLRNAFKK